MALDRSKLHQGYISYLTSAEKASAKRYEDFALVLSKSGLKSHGDLRSHLMEKLGLGHGHANAVVHIWREFDGGDAAMAKGATSAKGGIKKVAKPAVKARPKK
jgi:Domain of unknown function (DUF4287)